VRRCKGKPFYGITQTFWEFFTYSTRKLFLLIGISPVFEPPQQCKHVLLRKNQTQNAGKNAKNGDFGIFAAKKLGDFGISI